MTRWILLVCGILSSLLFVAVDIVAASRWEQYSYAHQAFSELVAVEAPTRPLMILGISIPYNLLVMAFAAGVWMSAAESRALRAVSVLLVVHAVTGALGSLVFPMHSRGAEITMTLTDKMHIVLTSLEVLSMLLFIGFGAVPLGRAFRFYSIATILVLVVGGGLAAWAGTRLAAGLPTPWLGLTERLNIYASMLWVAVFAVVLLQVPKSHLARVMHARTSWRTRYFKGINQRT